MEEGRPLALLLSSQIRATDEFRAEVLCKVLIKNLQSCASAGLEVKTFVVIS